MDKEIYKNMVRLLYNTPPKIQTPDGQMFSIGDVVRIVNPNSWFAKRYNKEHLFQIEYSYYQKYGGNDDSKKRYSLKHLFENNSTSWFDEEELELVKENEQK